VKSSGKLEGATRTAAKKSEELELMQEGKKLSAEQSWHN
jgi:hypothetical protein